MSESAKRKNKIKLVVSDFHIGPGLYLKDGTRNILEDFQYDDSFTAFLNYYSTGEYFDADVELVINGDFFNLLQINYMGVHTHLLTERIVLDGLKKSLEGHQEMFEAMKKFGKSPNHKISYVIGNHDQGMLFGKAKKYFSQYIEHDVEYYDSHYEFDGIRIEHGHMHEWNSRFDSKRYFVSRGLPEPVLNLPWGSVFVSEFLPKLKMERPYIDKVKPFRQMLRWMFINDIRFAFKTAFKILYYFIKSILFQGERKYFTVRGAWGLLQNITIYPDYDREARKVLANNSDIHALIMGHTHVLKYKRYREGKEFFNTGTWNEATNLQIGSLGTQLMLTYALIEYPEIPEGLDPATVHDKSLLRPKIKLKEWKGIWRPVVDAAI